MQKFDYIQPDSLKSASKYLTKKNGKAFAIGGGTDLLGMMKDNIVKPDALVNLKTLKDLQYIKYDEQSGLRIGALTKLTAIINSEVVKKYYSALSKAASEVATLQIRNVATIGGNVCQRPRCFYFRGDFDCIRKGGDTCFAVTGNNKYHCIVGGGPCYIVHPSDTAVALIALDAKFKIVSNKSEKVVSAKDFFILPDINETKENILNEGEILTEITIPPVSKSLVSNYFKVKERATWDFALVSIAGAFNINGKTIKSGKISFGGVAPVPWEEVELNKSLTNFKLNKKNVFKLADVAFKNADTLDMNEYKVILARNLVKKMLLEVI